jgi:hypothetical protein
MVAQLSASFEAFPRNSEYKQRGKCVCVAMGFHLVEQGTKLMLMLRQRPRVIWVAVSSLLLAVFFSIGGNLPQANAQTPEHRSHRFLDALRELGFFQESLDFLDLADKDPTVSQDLKNAIDYERGITLLELSKSRRSDLNQREKDLDTAEAAFKAYITARERDKYGLSAKIELGTVLMQRAAVAGFKATKPNSKKGELFAEARNKLKEAGDVFAKIEVDIKTRLEGFPKTGLSPAREAERDRLRDEYVRAQLLKAATIMESAKYVDPDSPQRKELLTSAANTYGDIHRKYSKFKAGLTAVNQKAECQRLMDAPKDALSTLEIILAQGEVPEIQYHYKEALGIGVPCWLALKQYDVLLARVGPVLEDMSERRLSEADIELKLAVARGGLALLKEYGQSGEKPAQYNGLRKIAIDEWKSLKRFPAYVQEANAALEQLGAAGASGGGAIAYVRPKTYQDARTKADELVKKYADNGSLLAAMIKKNDPVMAQQQAALETEQQETRKLAILYLRDCLLLATNEQTSDEINDVRFRLGYLARESKDYLPAAEMLEFVARRYPRFANASSCGQLSVIAYLEHIKENANDSDLTVEKNRAIKTGLYMVDTWPTDAKTIEVIAFVVPLLVQQGEVAQAVQLLEKVPNDAAKKGQLQIDVGQAVWHNYRRTFSKIRSERAEAVKDGKPTADFDAKQAENDKRKPIALQILEAGLGRMKDEPTVTVPTVVAALNLAEIYVEASDVDKALAMLNDPKFGPLTLIRLKDEKVKDIPNFALTTLRAALNANIGALASGKDPATHTEAAKSLMKEIVALTGDTEEGTKLRFGEFQRLAANLFAQLELADKEKQLALANGIQLFLDQVVSESNDPQSLMWAAHVYQKMIAIVGRDEKGKLNTQGTELAAKASAVLEKLEQAYASQKDAANQANVARLRANLNRDMGKFSEAIDIYESLLTDPKKRMNLAVQVDAAETFQEWAETTDPKMWQKAVMGDRMAKQGRPENIIWGWNKISVIVMNAGFTNNLQLEEMYFRSRLETARGVYKMTSLIKDEKKKKDNFQKAAGVIITTYNRFPNFDGPESKKKFDELLKEIQRAQGEALPQGLAGIKQAPPVQAPAVINAAAGGADGAGK